MGLGVVIAREESPSTSEFFFVVSGRVSKGQYVQLQHSQGRLFGYVSEMFKANRYFERAESVAEFEKGGGMSNFPSSSWEHTVALVKILGVYNKGFERAFSPPSPGAEVSDADTGILRSFLGFDPQGLDLGTIEHHDVPAKISMTRLLQKHFAILAMSGAGKSHLASVLLEELLSRKREDGRVAVIVVDIHGEYLGFAHDPVFGPLTTIVDGSGIAVPLKKVGPESVMEWLPNLSAPQRDMLRQAMSDLKAKNRETEGFSFKELLGEIEASGIARDEVKRALRRSLMELKRYHFLSRKAENPKLVADIKPGHLSILDFSSIDSLRKKQILVALLARRLFNLRKKGRIPPFLLLIEEAHNFAKEKAEESEAVSRSIIETIAREGRKFGACLCLISQRPVNLSTTALSQCVTPDTLIELNPGNSKEIGELETEWQDSRILTYDVEGNKLATASISNYIKNNPKAAGIGVFEIRTRETEKRVVATEDHPFWVQGRGWTPLRGISIGDKVAVKPQQMALKNDSGDKLLISKENISKILPPTIKQGRLFMELEKLSLLPLNMKNKKLPILARLVGHIFGDGTLHPPYKNPEAQHLLRITFTGKEPELMEIKKDLNKLGFSGNWKISRDFRESSCNFQKYGVKKIRGYSIYFKTGIVGIWALLRASGAPVGSKSGNDVRVPNWIMNAPLSIKREFLASYFGSEAQKIRMGVKSAERIIIPFSKHEPLSVSAEGFCGDILSLLSDFKIKASASKRDYTISRDGTRVMQYCITINRSRKNIINFCRNVGYRYNPERETQARLVLAYQEMLQNAIDKKTSLWSASSGCSDYRELKARFGIPAEDAKSLLRTKKMVKLSANKIPSFKEWKASATTGLGDGLIWETVGSKRQVDVSDVRDISVPKFHAFFANGFLTHNCNTHIILRVTNPNDLDQIQKSSEGIDARVVKSITGLKVGEGILVGEAVNHPVFIRIRDRRSEKREKGAPLHLQAASFEDSRERKERNVGAFV